MDIPSLVTISPELDQNMETAFFYGGGNHSFILTVRGRVYGVGLNSSGQLCIPNHAEVSFTSIEKLSAQTITSVACGWDFSIFLTNQGALYGCGSNKFGQLLHSSLSVQVLLIEILIEFLITLSVFLEFIASNCSTF